LTRHKHDLATYEPKRGAAPGKIAAPQLNRLRLLQVEVTKQYLSIRYTQRLAEAGLVASVGTTGDSYENAAAAASVQPRPRPGSSVDKGPCRNLTHVELALSEWVDWYNTRRLQSWRSYTPPVEYEQQHYRDHLEQQPPDRDNPASTRPGAIQSPL